MLGEKCPDLQPASLTEPIKNMQADPNLRNNNDCYRFGTWNVRTLTGKEMELIEEMKKHRLDGCVRSK